MNPFQQLAGKLDRNLLNRLLFDHTGRDREDLLRGPGYGVDTAVIDLGNGDGLAVSSDPLSLIPALGLRESAWLTVHLLANDMATTGFAPQWAQFVLNLPPDLDEESFRLYWQSVSEFCDEIGVAISGGHTGKVPGQQSTLPGGGTMFLKAPLEKILTTDGAQPGDRLVMSKEAALVSTSILARSFPETVTAALGEDLYRQARDNFYRTSALPEALAAAERLRPHRELRAMHDVTEGGVVGASLEMASASECSVRLNRERIPVGEPQRRIGRRFEIDPLYCVGAGSMIMAVAPGSEDSLIEYLEERSIGASVIGEIVSGENDPVMVIDEREEPIRFNGVDPYWAAFFKAMEEGWT